MATGWFATAFCKASSLLAGTSSYPSIVTSWHRSCNAIDAQNALLVWVSNVYISISRIIKRSVLTAYFCLVTAPLLSKIRIVRLGSDPSVPLDVLERIVHEATVAALVVDVVAVHELLLRQRHQLPGPDLVYALHSRDGRERPAAPFNNKYIHTLLVVKKGLIDTYRTVLVVISYRTGLGP